MKAQPFVDFFGVKSAMLCCKCLIIRKKFGHFPVVSLHLAAQYKYHKFIGNNLSPDFHTTSCEFTLLSISMWLRWLRKRLS